MTPTYANTFRMESGGTSETARRCLELIERHAPRLMLQGGGPLVASKCDCRSSPLDRGKAVKLARRGKTIAEISDTLGRTRQTVTNWLRKAGVPYVRLPYRRGRERDEAKVKRALELLETLKVVAVAKEVGVNEKTIYAWRAEARAAQKRTSA